jgi:hypothetical protein
MAAGSLFSFVISLDDKISHTAKEAGEHVKTLAETVEKASKSITVGVAGITDSMAAFKSGEIGEGIQALGESFAGAAKLLDLVVPGLGQAVSALIEIGSLAGGIFATLAEKGAELSLEAVEAKEKMITLFEALKPGGQSGEQVVQMLDNLSGSLGMTREKLEPLTQQFLAMGVKYLPDLRKQLTAAASATALMGEEGGKAYTNLAKKISITSDVLETLGLKNEKALVKWNMKLANVGVTFDDLAKAAGKSTKEFQAGLINGTIKAEEFGDALREAVTEKGEKPLEKLSENFDFLKEQAKSFATHLFEDVDIKPFIEGVKKLGESFGPTTAAGKALKFFVNQAFGSLFKIVGALLPYVTKFFLQLIIWSLKAYLLMKAHWEGITIAFKILGGALALIVAVFALMATSVAVIVSVMVGMTVAVFALGAAIIWVGYKLAEFQQRVIDAIPAAMDAIAKFTGDTYNALKAWVPQALEAAGNFIDGLVQGLENGIDRVVDAASSLGKEAAEGLKKALGISSPSKVMFEAGINTGEGFSDGLDATVAKVGKTSKGLAQATVDGAQVSTPQSGSVSQMDMGSMEPAPQAPQGAAQPAPSNTDNSSSSAPIFNIDIKIDGAGKDVHTLNEEMVSTVFERLQLSQGL